MKKTDAIKPPINKEKRTIQVEVNMDLFNEFESERTKQKISKRKVIEFGIAKWLESVSPSSAERIKHLFK